MIILIAIEYLYVCVYILCKIFNTHRTVMCVARVEFVEFIGAGRGCRRSLHHMELYTHLKEHLPYFFKALSAEY